MKRFGATFLVFFAAVFGYFFVFSGFVLAQGTICPAGQYEVLCNLDPEKNPNFVGNIVQFLIVLAIVLSVLFLVWGGVRWIMSGGDKGKLDQARSTITAAIIGLAISLLAYFIVSMVLYFFTGSGSLQGLRIPRLTDN